MGAADVCHSRGAAAAGVVEYTSRRELFYQVPPDAPAAECTVPLRPRLLVDRRDGAPAWRGLLRGLGTR